MIRFQLIKNRCANISRHDPFHQYREPINKGTEISMMMI